MSGYMVPEVVCDGRGCGRVFLPCDDATTVDKLRDQALNEHWVHLNGRDLCPGCHREEINPTPRLQLAGYAYDPEDAF